MYKCVLSVIISFLSIPNNEAFGRSIIPKKQPILVYETRNDSFYSVSQLTKYKCIRELRRTSSKRCWCVCLAGKKSDDDYENKNANTKWTPSLEQAGITLLSILVAIIFVTTSNNPMADFDVDFFMALDRVIQAPVPADDIIAFPRLSPAEELVGALFGPPNQ
mmetsp:Transcript_21493/g.24702  ORF Transcript_21493/g.24702 Transcript_21493/m.24702 type:complete len:163 (-) Transcript_21493:69-557(-)